MATSFYDFSVANYLQTLGAVSGFLAKGREHCLKNGIDLGQVVETKLVADMLPFRFQIVSAAHHSAGVAGRGEPFDPPAARRGRAQPDTLAPDVGEIGAAGLERFAEPVEHAQRVA